VQEGFAVAEVHDSATTIALARTLRPATAVISSALRPVSWLRAVREITRTLDQTRIMLVINTLSEGVLLEGLRSGVRGFALAAQHPDVLVSAIKQVFRGQIYIAPDQVPPGQLADKHLSPRARQVLQLIAEGKTTKEVAASLRITFRTADYHRTHLMRTLNIHDTAGLVRYAIRNGL